MLSYFEFYFNLQGQKSLRAFSLPLWLASNPPYSWEYDEASVERLAERLAERRKFSLLDSHQRRVLSPIDERLRQ